MKSIRSTLLRGLFAGVLALFLTGAAALHTGVGWLLTRQFDTALRTKLATFTSLLEQEGREIELSFVEDAMPEFSATTEPEYFELRVFEGPSLYRSPSLVGEALLAPVGTETEPAIEDLVLPDGRRGRAIGASFFVHDYEPMLEDPGPAHVTLVLARSRSELDEAQNALLLGILFGMLLFFAAAFLVGRGAVRRGLRPLGVLTEHVQGIADPTQAQRFSTTGVPEELVPLVESHNELLERIQRAFERERRTAANIAHELRTPLTELGILSEMAERFAHDPGETANKLREMREVSGQMSSMVSTLLELARMESGRVSLEIEPIELTDMLRSSWSALHAKSEPRRLAFQLAESEPVWVHTDRVALSILIANLLTNAVDHAPPGDEIGCEIESRNERVHLTLTNASNGLAPEDVDKLTEAFWRSSASREDRAHAGLGLSLAARLATLLGLELSFAVRDGCFQVRVDFGRVPERPRGQGVVSGVTSNGFGGSLGSETSSGSNGSPR